MFETSNAGKCECLKTYSFAVCIFAKWWKLSPAPSFQKRSSALTCSCEGKAEGMMQRGPLDNSRAAHVCAREQGNMFAPMMGRPQGPRCIPEETVGKQDLLQPMG